jgi:hypothetical protein
VMGCLGHARHLTIAHFLNLFFDVIDVSQTSRSNIYHNDVLMRKVKCQISRGTGKIGGIDLRTGDCTSCLISCSNNSMRMMSQELFQCDFFDALEVFECQRRCLPAACEKLPNGSEDDQMFVKTFHMMAK